MSDNGFCCTQEGETHAERLERLRQQSVPATKLTSSQRHRHKRKLQAQHKQMQPAQKRCGKRQRAELKAQVFQQADTEGSKITSQASAIVSSTAKARLRKSAKKP